MNSIDKLIDQVLLVGGSRIENRTIISPPVCAAVQLFLCGYLFLRAIKD